MNDILQCQEQLPMSGTVRANRVHLLAQSTCKGSIYSMRLGDCDLRKLFNLHSPSSNLLTHVPCLKSFALISAPSYPSPSFVMDTQDPEHRHQLEKWILLFNNNPCLRSIRTISMLRDCTCTRLFRKIPSSRGFICMPCLLYCSMR